MTGIPFGTRAGVAADLRALGRSRSSSRRAGGVAMIGAPWDTMTLLHHAEHLADLPGKRVVRYEVPFATPDGIRWRTVTEFDTGGGQWPNSPRR